MCIDFLHLDKCQGYEYVLLVSDHFSRFCMAYPTKSKSSKAAAEKLFKEHIPKFGFPAKIHHDQGPEFNSTLFQELHRLAGIKMSNTTPYHPMGNGAVERINKTLINMLKSLPDNQKKKWKDHLPALMFAYNSTIKYWASVTFSFVILIKTINCDVWGVKSTLVPTLIISL